MAKKNNNEKPNLESRIKQLENRVTKLETQLEKKLNRQKREYTDEERAIIRARLLAGQEAARKRREGETKTQATEKTESGKTKRTKKIIRNEKPKDTTEQVSPLEVA